MFAYDASFVNVPKTDKSSSVYDKWNLDGADVKTYLCEFYQYVFLFDIELKINLSKIYQNI